MRRRQIFVDEAAGVELVLPVTPGSYAWENGINMETVNIDGLGDIVLPGRKALDTRPVDCFFPAHSYEFNEPDTVLRPFFYVEQIEKWAQGRTPLRYIVSGTPLNASVLIQSLKYGEEDGTNNVSGVITLRQYQAPEVLRSETAQPAAARSADTQSAKARTYTVQAGDTLSGIARKFYGDAGKYPGLAAANGIKNPNLIHPGQVLTIPEGKRLPAGNQAKPRSQKAAEATQVVEDPQVVEGKRTGKMKMSFPPDFARKLPASDRKGLKKSGG